MDFNDVLRRRRMGRSYEERPIPREVLDRVTAVVRRAPSAGFSQGHRLVVVTGQDNKRAVAAMAGEDGYVRSGLPPWISTAAALVVVAVREGDYHDRYRQPDKLTDDEDEIEWPVPYWYVDSGALFLLVQLAAINEGLSTGFFGLGDYEPLRELLAIPDDITPTGVITLGYPAEEPADVSSRATRPQREMRELVHWERWE